MGIKDTVKAVIIVIVGLIFATYVSMYLTGSPADGILAAIIICIAHDSFVKRRNARLEKEAVLNEIRG